MPEKGYTPIRSIPEPSEKLTNNDYYLTLVDFFKYNKVCPHCDGRGYTLSEPIESINYSNKITTIKYKGIKELEQLHKLSNFPFTTRIKEIFEKMFYGRKQCEICHGGGIIEK